MSCGCKHAMMSTDEAALARVHYPKPRAGLRRGARLPVEGAEELESASMAVDVNRAWRMMAQEAYPSGDLLVVAMREALQNSVDAIGYAYSGKDGLNQRVPPEYRLERGEGQFRVTWDVETRTLTFEDNGIGMSEDTLRSKFLVLGASGKGGEGSESVGGFGVAKAVILGISDSSDWELWTRDLHAYPAKDGSGRVHIHRVPAASARRGTKLVTRGVSERYARIYYTPIDPDGSPADRRMRTLLGACKLPDIRLYYNDQLVHSLFSSGGTRKAEYEDLDWGDGTTVTVRAYRRPGGLGYGAIYVRTGGQAQFIRRPAGKGTANRDFTVDVKTTKKPQDYGYPFPTSREGFKGDAARAFEALESDLAREEPSVDAKDFATFIMESDDDDERREAETMSAEVREVLSASGIQETLEQVLGKISAFADAEAKNRAVKPARSNTRGDGDEAESSAPGRPAPTLGDTFDLDRESTRPPSGSVSDAVRVVTEAIGTEGASWSVRETLERVTSTGTATISDLALLTSGAERAIEERLDAADSGGMATGLAEAGAVSTALATIARASAVAAPRPVSPYSKTIAVMVSNKNYNARSAAWFRKGIAKQVHKLIVWDLTLRLIIQEAKISVAVKLREKTSEGGGRSSIKLRFRPGFVLDDTVRGMMSRQGGRAFILMNPDYFDDAVRAHKSRPWAIAGYLHNLACHEIAHLAGNSGEEEHSTSWAIEREDLAVATAHLLPAIEEAVTAVLGFKRRPTAADKALAKCNEKLVQREQAVAGARRVDREARAQASALQAANAQLDMVRRVGELRRWLLTPPGAEVLRRMGAPVESTLRWSIENEAKLVQALLEAERK